VWKVKRNGIILFVVIFALYLAIGGSASATTIYVDDDGPADYAAIQAAVDNSSSGDTITVNPGTYPGNITITVPDLVLVSSSPYNAIIRATKNAFNLNANNITIKNFNIIGTGSSGYSGVRDNSFFCTIQNNKISSFNTGIGVYTGNEGGSGSIINNAIFDCSGGILLFSSNDNKISGNRISNCETGLDLVDSYGTIIYNNNFNNTRNVQFTDTSDWNITKTPGKNIIGGPYIGGNYWATPAGDGFSQTHSDANGDGIAEEPYYMNEANIDYLPLVIPWMEPAATRPSANFKANTTSGNAPLSVLFTDLSQNATSRSWNFGDGATSTEHNSTHSYSLAGTYTVNLTVSNQNGTASKIAVITVLEEEEDENKNNSLPVADLSTNVTSGNAPFSVLFTDLSQNATSRSWDVNNDGIEDSNEASFVYTYTSTGTYTVNLTVSNANGTVSKTTLIDIEKKSSAGSSGGSSGGGGGSPEPAKNVEVKELSQVFITNGKAVKFDFAKNATCVVYVSFDAKKTAGKTTTIVEELKNKSALVSELPADEVYKSFNLWVGNSGFATSKNIENPIICFKVEKTWTQDKKIDKDSIILNRYSDEEWEQLPVNLSGEDNKFLYFTAKTPAFSSFVITGKVKELSKEEATETEPDQETRFVEGDMKSSGEKVEQSAAQGEDTKAPGFEMVYGIICLSAIFLYKRKQKS
jgi:PGF-pre-PGF domain-containing protein